MEKKWVKHGIAFIDNIGIIKCTFVLKGNTRGTWRHVVGK